MSDTDFDLIVIGADDSAFPLLQRSAGSGQSVAAFLPQRRHPGSLVVQALRDLNLSLMSSQSAMRQFRHASPAPRLLRKLACRAIHHQLVVQSRRLNRLGVQVYYGAPRFEPSESSGNHVLAWNSQQLTARCVLLATGVCHVPLNPADVSERFWRALIPSGYQHPLMRSLDEVFELPALPSRVIIFGGCETGFHVAVLLQLAGVDVTVLVEQSEDSAAFEMAEEAGVSIVSSIGCRAMNDPECVVLDCRRIEGCSGHLNLQEIGITPDESGRLWCGAGFETWCPNVFAIGPLVGFCTESAITNEAAASRILSRIQRLPRKPHLLRRYHGLGQLAGRPAEAV